MKFDTFYYSFLNSSNDTSADFKSFTLLYSNNNFFFLYSIHSINIYKILLSTIKLIGNYINNSIKFNINSNWILCKSVNYFLYNLKSTFYSVQFNSFFNKIEFKKFLNSKIEHLF